MKLLFVFGTRPEAIKMAPLIREAKNRSTQIETLVCSTGQHREMLDQILGFFNMQPDIKLDIMKQGQDLFDITSNVLVNLKNVITGFSPDIVLIQGDTTTAFAAALASYYLKTKVGHIEAGLRTYNMYSPFPEEVNRKIISQIAAWHFAPTYNAKVNLNKEGIIDNVFVTGNTVTDALLWGLDIVKGMNQTDFYKKFSAINFNKKIILVTGHRRESFGDPFREICMAIKHIAETYPEVEIVYPVHLNPHVQKPVYELLNGIKNVNLMDPLTYLDMIWLMNKCYLILTDSGGIQEEAPTLGKPVIVMRDFTERTEGIDAGNALLSGASYEKVIGTVNQILKSDEIYKRMANSGNPYGDGKSSERIIRILLDNITI